MARLFVLLGLAAVQLSFRVEGHGVLKIPSSRSWECISASHQGNNKDCEIRTVWGIQNYGTFPDSGPVYGNIASAGMAAKTVLDEQSETRWWKNAMKSGRNTFQWEYRRDGANHPTIGFKYFITVPAWDPNWYLHANAFEAEPFCEFDLGGAEPPLILNHVCTVPARTGYHVILAMWYGSNGRSFYQVVDADFGGKGGGGGGPSAVGLLSMKNYNNVAESITNSPSPYYGKGTGPQYLVPVGLPPMPSRPTGSTAPTTPAAPPAVPPAPPADTAVPIGRTIWLKNDQNEFVYVRNTLLASRDSPMMEFKVVNAGNGYVALLAANGKYVSADRRLNRVAPVFVADREKVGSWEKFEWVSLGGNKVALKARVNGRYAKVNYASRAHSIRAATSTKEPFRWGTTD